MKDSFGIFKIVLEASKQEYAKSFLDSIGNYHPDTFLHSMHVAVTAAQIGDEFGLDEMELNLLATGALLHDIGKIKIPLSILNKREELSVDEFFLIKRHPEFSYDLLYNSPNIVRNIGLLHHRYLNGNGYPDLNVEIPLLSRIVTVADIFCAITSPRAYKDTMPYIYAIGELYRSAARKEVDIRFVQILDNIVFFNRLFLNTGLMTERADILVSK